MLRVFVSSTSVDLRYHRQTVKDVILDVDWHPVLVNEHGGPASKTTVKECVSKLEGCHLLVLLVAHRRGWVPGVHEDGDGESSVTALELQAARQRNIDILVFMADGTWPTELSSQETETDRAWIKRFRGTINQPAGWIRNEGRYTTTGEPEPGPDFKAQVREALVGYKQEKLGVSFSLSAGVPGRAGLAPLLPELVPILARVLPPPHAATQAYQHCVPAGPRWSSPPGDLDPRGLLNWCAGTLASANRQHDGRVPLLLFLRCLMPLLPKDESEQLGGWIEQAIVHLGQDEAERLVLRAANAAPARPAAPQERASLFVQARAAGVEDGAYFLKAWLSGVNRPLRVGEQRLSVEALKADFQDIYREARRKAPPDAELWIELLLPWKLLGKKDFDAGWWDIPAGLMDEDVPLGIKHRVIVRVLERLRCEDAPDIMKAWRGRWNTLWEQRERLCRLSRSLPPDPADCPAVRPAERLGRGLFAKLELARNVVCVVAGCPPDPPVRKGNDLLGILEAGIPASLWLRGGTDGIADLESRLQQTPLGQLPSLVKDLRLEADAAGDPAHVGRRLELMWDDPDSPPPDDSPAPVSSNNFARAIGS